MSTLSVELKNINDVIESTGELDFVSLDIEYLDKVVLEMVVWKSNYWTAFM